MHAQVLESLLHLLFPHLCAGCGSELPASETLCIECLDALPQTGFHLHANNPVEKVFWGRLPLTHATAQYFFTKGAILQRLMHRFKYRNQKELGHYLGTLMGHQLLQSNRFRSVEALIPLPLSPRKQFQRGYNQATVLCDGMAAVLQIPVFSTAVVRTHNTESQTKKNRVERWQNMEGRFAVAQPHLLQGKHLLLVDDVVTTGATLEACGRELLQVPDVRLSIATLCFAYG